MPSPAEMMADLLPNTVSEGTTGWKTKIGKLVSEPDKVVVFYDTGGQNPNPKWSLDFPTVQAWIRCPPNTYAVGYNKAKEVRDVFLGIPSQDVAGVGRLVSITCMGDVGFINYDDSNRPSFTVNFRLIIEPDTNALTSREPL